MGRVAHSSALMQALVDAGLADQNTRRVVIDIDRNEPPVIYIERYDDGQLIKVIEALASVEVEKR